MLDIQEAIDCYEQCLTSLLDHLATNAQAHVQGAISEKLQSHITALIQADKRYNRALVEAKKHLQASTAMVQLQAQESALDAQLEENLQVLRTLHTELRKPLSSNYEPARLSGREGAMSEGEEEVPRIACHTLMQYARILAKTSSAPSSFDPTTHSATASSLFPWPSEDMMRRGAGSATGVAQQNGEMAMQEDIKDDSGAAEMEPTSYQAQNQPSMPDNGPSGLDLDLFDPDQDED
ncbi:vitamin-D-receptor interacting mediator subunit 4-domain-containing protein [Protomyces lactucae-debilis]|uniref:Mediator of RNA polymerase II transcription subunit 4 n=1 Tax=Protomyces lactucae-debilis TaxID=2754530 RepID=A0A1Y2FDM2_PROLT|nr:vitamin-D-receptor interacting mediator subunit 4-domain-containing protein [Protomyces lactucae-debilis]ORY82030.1 vitamin-D-receptor interacting mediator subunit 4-domain-containing protein [Protomyces lactucae-debilis]